MSSTWQVGLVVVAVVAGGFAAGTSQTPTALEYEIKAVFLMNFARYVEWPAQSPQADVKRPIVVGVLGRDPFGTTLDEALRDRTVQGRPLVARRYRKPEEIDLCHVLFVSPSADGREPGVLKIMEKSAVLTVTDEGRAGTGEGIIHFSMEGQKVRFAVDLQAAQRSGLRISSQLLKIAARVRGLPP